MTEMALADWAPEVHTLVVVPEVPELMGEALSDDSTVLVAANVHVRLLAVLNWHKS